ncbi:Myb-like dna-binding protein [Globisporangium polare]
MENDSKRDRDLSDEDLLASFHAVPSESRRVKVNDEDKGAGKRWTPEQDEALRTAVDEFGQRNWKSIASRVPGRNHAQCLQRWNKVLKPGLVKGHWSYEEDSILERMVLQGCHSWGEVAAHIPGRTAKQCRERWRNHLDPSINKAPFTPEEDFTIQQAFENYGNRWTQIAELLPGRTEDAVKLRWKSLNPNLKTNAKPGRPKLVPGMNANKPRSTAPPNPDEIAAAIMAPIPDMNGGGNTGLPYQEMYAPSSYDYSNANAYATASPHMSSPLHAHPQQQQYHQQQQHVHSPQQQQSGYAQSPLQQQTAYAQPQTHQHAQPQQHLRSHLPSDLPEPIVEPQESKEEVDSKDAAILKELLRSFSNSLMSFEGSRGLTTSISDLSPEDLLASGELDEMLRQVSLANRPPGASSSFRMSGRSSRSSSKSSLNLSSGQMDSFSRAVQTMGNEEKNMFQGLIDQLRASGGGAGDSDGVGGGVHQSENNVLNLPMDSGLFTSFSSNSAKNLLHSLDYQDDDDSDNDIARSSSTIGLSPAVADATSEIDDLFDPSVMRPIRKGVQY